MDGQLPDAVKAERLAALQDVLNAGQRAFNRAATGRVVPVLFDRRGRHPLQLVGRTPHMQAVHVEFDDAEMVESCHGEIAMVQITAVYANSLSGRVLPHGGPEPVAQRRREAASA